MGKVDLMTSGGGKTDPELQGEVSVSQPQGKLHKPDEEGNGYSSVLLRRVEDSSGVIYGQFTNKQIWNII